MFYGECQKCKDKNLKFNGDDKPTWYYQWVTEKIERSGAKNLMYNVKMTSKKIIECMLSELVNQLNTNIYDFTKHVYQTGRIAIDKIGDDLKINQALLVVDFSQNDTAKYSEQIQAAHFDASQKQLPLHTGDFFYKDNENKKICVFFCTVSECLRHDPAAIWADLDPVLKLMKKHIPCLTTIHVQSDGPSTQYKNKTNFFLFQYFCNELNLKFGTWNFTAPGHGKSVADGIGGTLKNYYDRLVAQGKDIISTKSMVDAINTCGEQKIKSFLIEEAEMKNVDLQIQFQLKPAPSTKKIFQIVW